MKKTIFLSIINISLQLSNSYGQLDNCNEFVVITYERVLNVNQYSLHGVETYYWIIPSDSIYDKHISIFPLFLDGFSKNNFDSCCSGKPFEPFTITKFTSYEFDSAFVSQVNLFKKLIRNNRKKVQTIEKKWTESFKEKVDVYATPVKGVFCNSVIITNWRHSFDYKGDVYMPKSSFQLFDKFWGSQKERLIKLFDYDKIKFALVI